jgi:hypothetical protein
MDLTNKRPKERDLFKDSKFLFKIKKMKPFEV